MSVARPSVLLTRRWPSSVETVISRSYAVSFDAKDRAMSSASIADALRVFDFVCPTVTDRIDAQTLSGRRIRTRALCNFGAGLDHIDLGACAAAGLLVTNTPDVLPDDTADLAMLLALMCARRAGEGERLVRSGGWKGWAPTHLLGNRLSGKTMGIVGFGRIGRATAQRAHRGFGMNVLYTSRRSVCEAFESGLGARRVPLDQMFREADVISLHVPGGESTRGLVDARRLSLMKTSAILVNTSRGEIVDEEALIASLSRGEIAAAGLDVYQNEPRIRPELRALGNAVLLPHLGSATQETRVAMGLRVVANLDAIVAGQAPPDRVV